MRNKIEKFIKPEGEVIILDNMKRTIMEVPPAHWDSITIKENLIYETGDLIIDRHGKIVYKGGNILLLTPTEYELLVYLVEHYTLFCSRKNLKDMVNSRFRHEIADNTLSKHIHRTRAKLDQTSSCKYVSTQNCKGYKWNLPVSKKYINRD